MRAHRAVDAAHGIDADLPEAQHQQAGPLPAEATEGGAADTCVWCADITSLPMRRAGLDRSTLAGRVELARDDRRRAAPIHQGSSTVTRTAAADRSGGSLVLRTAGRTPGASCARSTSAMARRSRKRVRSASRNSAGPKPGLAVSRPKLGDIARHWATGIVQPSNRARRAGAESGEQNASRERCCYSYL